MEAWVPLRPLALSGFSVLLFPFGDQPWLGALPICGKLRAVLPPPPPQGALKRSQGGLLKGGAAEGTVVEAKVVELGVQPYSLTQLLLAGDNRPSTI